MLLPWTDWQFWLVTVIASWGAWIVFRQLLPRPRSSTACGACAAGTAACAKHAAKAALTPSGSEAEPQLVVFSRRRRE